MAPHQDTGQDPDIDTRSLRYFLALAEELSFRRAAARLGLNQTSLTGSIARLEDRLGARLFVRTTREVHLTPAGRALVTIGRGLLAEWEAGKAALRAATAAQSWSLRVGFEVTGAGPLTSQAQVQFTYRFPKLKLHPRRFEWAGAAPALRDGLVDVAFIWLPTTTTGLRYEVVAEESRIVGLPARHRLARRKKLGVADLRDEPIVWPAAAPRKWVRWWAVEPRPDGSEPKWGPSGESVEETLALVAAREGICVAPASMESYYTRADLVWRPLTDAAPLRIALAWDKDVAHPLVPRFAAVVKELSPLDFDA